MKTTFLPSRIPLAHSIAILLAAMAAWSSPHARAATYTWDGDTGTAGAQDGGGIWNTTNTNWLNAGINSVWANANTATFGGGVDGTYAVTVALDPTATGLAFNNSGYTLSAAVAQTITVSSTTAAIVLASGKLATIGSNVTVTTPAASQNSVVSGTGTLTIENGGTLKNSGTANTNILNINSTTVEVKTGGSLLTAPVVGGNGTAIFVNGVLNVLGGNVSAVGTMGIGQSAAVGTTAGTLTISSGTVAATSTNGIRFGANSGTTPGGTVNLNGGTLTAAILFKGAGTVTTSVFNFNGGTLQASATSATFLQGLGRANVRNGGVVIDMNARNITIGQALEHSNIGGDSATDGGLIKRGAGTLILNGVNTYTGGTTINAGALQFGVGPVPTGLITINSGGTLNAAGALTTVTEWLDAGTIAQVSTGAIALTSDSFEDINFANYPTVRLGASVNATHSGIITPAGTNYRLGGGGATLTLANANALTGTNSVLIGAAGSTGTVAITNTNDYTGITTINGGTLQLGNGITDGSIASSSGIANNSAIAFNVATSQTFNQPISGTGTLTKLGAGTLILGGVNTYSGITTLANGTLQLANSGALGASEVSSFVGTAQLQLAGDITVTNPIRLTGGGLAAGGILRNVSGTNTLTDFGFVIGGGTRVAVDAGSTLNLPNSIVLGPASAVQNFRVIGAGTVVLGGDNTAAIGAANLFLIGLGTETGPTVKIANELAFGLGTIDFQPLASGAVQSSDATARTIANPIRFSDFAAGQATFGAIGTGDLTFTSPVTLSGNLDLKVDNAKTTFTNAVTGLGLSLTKSGDGTLILDGAQNYDTLTTSGGITDLNGALGTGTSVLNADADTNIGSSQTLAALNIGDGATVTFTAIAPPPAPAFAPVPEPGACGLLAGGSVLLSFARRRRIV